MKTILLTGGTGLTGNHLTHLLVSQGFDVRVLSRNHVPSTGSIRFFKWDVEKHMLPEEPLRDADAIIHLAGESISKRWTKHRRERIWESRIRSTDLLFDKVAEYDARPKVLLAASGSGYYGATTGDKIFVENDPSGDDFLARVCTDWEDRINRFRTRSIRTVIFRTGVVLSAQGGMLQKVLPMAKLGLMGKIGSGRQYMPWIHIDDLCRLYQFALVESHVNGIYNAVAPEHISQADFAKTLSSVIGQSILAPPTPAFFLQFLLGEMSALLLEGSRVSSDKIIEAGFRFQYPVLEAALSQLLHKIK